MLIVNKRLSKIRRKNVVLKFTFFRKIHYRYFCFSSKVKTPTNVLGNRSTRNKKKCNFSIFWNYLKTSHPYMSLSIVTYIFFSIKIFKFISIIKNSQGSVYSKLSTSNHRLFFYFFFKIKDKSFIGKKSHLIFNILNKLQYESFVYLLRRRSFICCIELFFNKGHQYARATGSKARILDTDKDTKTIQILLPSKEIKTFDMYSTCNANQLLLSTKKKLMFDNKRYKRFSGFGPQVRGVAMNAIDHPHGGKTKSIKYPKTPWGLTTKFK